MIEFALARNGLSIDSFVALPDFDVTSFLSRCFGEAETDARDIGQIIEIIGTFAATMPINTRQIDIASLLPLVYQRHFNLSESQLLESALARIPFNFHARERDAGVREIPMKYSDVWLNIERHSESNFQRKDPRNTLEYWIQAKNHDELKELNRVTGEYRRIETIRQEYSRILDQVSNISGPSDETS